MPSVLIDTYSIPKNASWAPVALPDGVTLTSDIELGSLTENGFLRVENGVLYYKPDAGFDGVDSFVVEGTDGTDSYTFTIDMTVSIAEAQPQHFYDDRVLPEVPTSDSSIVLAPVAEFERLNGANQRFNSFDFTDNGRYFASTDGRVDGEGRIYELVPNGDGTFETEFWFDAGAAVLADSGLDIDNSNFIFGGLRGIAFHPDFENNGKFYISMMQKIPEDKSGHNYIGPIYDEDQNGDSVVAEFTVDPVTGDVIAGSYRELFRVSVPVDDHPIRQIEFNKFAEPGDEDYGLLYIAHGDGSIQSATSGGGLRNDALGKILRVDPLQDGENPYSVPETNPFVDTTEMPDEVYAIGFRNPHTLAFSKDADGNAHLFVGEVGRDNAEEINHVVPGGNYGWSDFEGIFSLERNPGTLTGVRPLDEAHTAEAIAEKAIFPAAFIGHFGFIEFDAEGNPVDGQVGGGQAIASGHAISTESILKGQFIFGDFAKGGRFYDAALEDLISTNSIIPEGGTIADVDWVTPAHMTLLFDHDNDPNTTPLVYSNILDAIDKTRSDIRFNQGPDGQMYLTTKRDGKVYVVANADPNYADVVFGTSGDDELFAYGGDDLLFGDLGEDTLITSDGQDTVTGGLGRDVFKFSFSEGVDEVTDFHVGYDQLDLDEWFAEGIVVSQRVSGDDIELYREDTGDVIGILRGAATRDNAGPVATDDRFNVLDGDLADAGPDGVVVSSDGVLANDGDPDSDVFSLSTVGGSADNIGQWVAGSNGGLFRITESGQVEFSDDDMTVAAGETTSISYSIVDGEGATDSAEVVVRVRGTPVVNAAPVAGDDFFVAPEGTDGAYTRLARISDGTSILNNDVDPDGDPLGIVAINENGFNVSTVGYNVWFDGDNGGEFRVFDTGVVDFRFSEDEYQAGATTGFDYTVVDPLDDNGFGRVEVIWGGGANDDDYVLTSEQFEALGDGLIAVGRTSDDTTALANDIDGATIVAIDGEAGQLGSWVDGSNGGQFRVFSSGVVQFRNQGEAAELGDITTVSYTIDTPNLSGETLTAQISLTIGDVPLEDEAIDDIYELTASEFVEAGTSWFRLGALRDDSDLLANDGDVVSVTGINNDALEVGVWFDGDNGGQFRVFDSGVVDFRNQGTELTPGNTTSFEYTGVSEDGTENTAVVSLVVDEFILI